MRAFAALSLPDWLGAAVEPLLPAVPAGVRAIPPGRWHLTLAFYGELDDAGVTCIEQRLGRRLRRAQASPVELRIDGGGAFHGGAAFLAVVGLRPGEDARLRDIATVCRRTGLACGAPGSQGRDRFRAHITVARANRREAVPIDFAGALQDVRSEQWQASRVELVASHLGAQPQYEVVADFRLG